MQVFPYVLRTALPSTVFCLLVQAKLDAIRFLSAAIKQREIELREKSGAVDDGEVIKVCVPACTMSQHAPRHAVMALRVQACIQIRSYGVIEASVRCALGDCMHAATRAHHDMRCGCGCGRR